MNKAFKVFEFFKCPIRKYFITYIDKSIFTPGEYLCRFYVNGNFTLDQRYKYFPNSDNNLYNLIYIGDTKTQIGIGVNPKKNKKKKKKKKILVEEEEENSDDFYYYCYNDNTNSTNSLSTKSYNENNLGNKKNRNKYSIDSQSIKKEKSIQSQKNKYNNILNELNQSISSSKSHFSLNNKINAYSKNTHKTKFGNNKKK